MYTSLMYSWHNCTEPPCTVNFHCKNIFVVSGSYKNESYEKRMCTINISVVRDRSYEKFPTLKFIIRNTKTSRSTYDSK